MLFALDQVQDLIELFIVMLARVIVLVVVNYLPSTKCAKVREGRRAEREKEQQLREEEEIRMQRLAESAQMSEWLAKDGDFQLEQEKRRAGIRLKEKRAKAVDFLVLNLKYVNPSGDADGGLGIDEAGLEIDLDEPYTILEV